MPHNMPNKDDTTLTKRKAVQSVMQDGSLSALERNKKIQDIMSGRAGLLRVVAAKEPASTAFVVDPTRKRKAPRARKARDNRSNRSNEIDRDDSLKGVHSSNINDANEAETYCMPTEIAINHYLKINNLHT